MATVIVVVPGHMILVLQYQHHITQPAIELVQAIVTIIVKAAVTLMKRLVAHQDVILVGELTIVQNMKVMAVLKLTAIVIIVVKAIIHIVCLIITVGLVVVLVAYHKVFIVTTAVHI